MVIWLCNLWDRAPKDCTEGCLIDYLHNGF